MLLFFLSPNKTLKEQKSAYLEIAMLSLSEHLNVKTKSDSEQLWALNWDAAKLYQTNENFSFP